MFQWQLLLHPRPREDFESVEAHHHVEVMQLMCLQTTAQPPNFQTIITITLKNTHTHTFTIIYIYYRYIVIYIYARSQKYLNCIRAWVREREGVCVRACVCVYKCAIGHEMVDINTLHQGTPLWIMALPIIASSPVVSENMVSQNPTVYRFPCELCRVGACRPCRSSCSGARSRCSQPCLGSGLPILPRLKGFQEAIKGSYCILFDSESRMLSPGKFRSGLWAAVRGRYRCKRTS